MASALKELIDVTPWIDTHEHVVEERSRLRDDTYRYIEREGVEDSVPGDWTALLVNYAVHDLVSAGLSTADRELVLGDDLGPREKWDRVAPFYEAAKNTGYVRAVDLTTTGLFGARLGADSVEQIDAGLRRLRVPGYYAAILRDYANVERCQVNSVEHNPFCDTASPHLLDQDLSIVVLVTGRHREAERLSGIDVHGLDDYVDVIEWCFERFASRAIAVKCQWAYDRPLAVAAHDAPPRAAFNRLRRGEPDLVDRRRVEDYLFGVCVEQAVAYRLPVKLHLGYLAGNDEAHLPEIVNHVRDVAALAGRHPKARFVLMHMAWPQQEQLLALAKHRANVFVDLCWAWIVSPVATCDFVRRFLTTAPANKLLCFGGDYTTIENVIGHAEIARRGLELALRGLVDDGWLNEHEALALVPQLMRNNAERLFGTRGAT